MKKIFNTIVFLLVSVVTPILILNPRLITDGPILLASIAGVFLSVAQPHANFAKEEGENLDKSSLQLIAVSVLLCFSTSVIEYVVKRSYTLNYTSGLGLILVLIGFSFRYWSIKVLGKFFTSKVLIQNSHELVQYGPYKLIRHPSYTGAWVGVLGVTIFLHSLYGFLVCTLVYFPAYIYRIYYEEKALSVKFVGQYEKYKKETWRMFPYLF